MTDFVQYTLPKEVFLEETVVKKSRFIAYATCIKNADQAKDFVAGIKKKHFDATHNCYAYVIKDTMKFFDDGEPNGTAGKPILNAIISKNLIDTVIVVTRYFGGVKLGAGGLSRAYGNAALNVIGIIPLVKLSNCIDLEIIAPYTFSDIIISVIKKFNFRYQSFYEADVTFKVITTAEKCQQIISAVLDATNGKVSIKEGQPYIGEI